VLLDISPDRDLPTSRLPLNLCLVLDRSTSMQGVRLQQVKEATHRIIDYLQPIDTFSLVVFSDRSEVLLPGQQDIDKALAKSVASTIQPSGGTEMLQGLLAGLKEIQANRTENAVNHIILLTDGQTYGDVPPGELFLELNVSVFTFYCSSSIVFQLSRFVIRQRLSKWQ